MKKLLFKSLIIILISFATDCIFKQNDNLLLAVSNQHSANQGYYFEQKADSLTNIGNSLSAQRVVINRQ